MDINIRNFWETGSGKQLIQWSGAQVSLSGLDAVNQLSQSYDHLGDDALETLFKDRNFAEAYTCVTQLAQAKVSETDELPAPVKKLFLTLQEKPAWLDKKLIKAGCDLCMRSGTNALISLRDYSLISGYDYAYLNKALLYTGALRKGAAKRITDTLDFWIQVTRHTALDTNACGYQYIARTRMIHSFSRIKIKEAYADWNTEKWGEPINWGDMIATNIAFSLFYLHGLHKLGLRISEKEESGVFHLWKYIGYLLGIPANHLPDNKKEATEIFYLWTQRQTSADEGSVMLAKALEHEAVVSNIFKKTYQKNFLKYLHICYVRFLLDKETCNRLHVSTRTLYFLFPLCRKLRNIIPERLIAMSDKNYQLAVHWGNILQTKISEEYLKADSTKK